MAKFNTELFIARRLGGAGNVAGGGTGNGFSGGSGGSSGGESRGVMVRIAVATTAVSIAVMIVAVAVIMGFRAEIASKITAFTGHLSIQALDYSGSNDSAPILLSPAMERDLAAIEGVISVAPYAMKLGIVKTDEATQGVMLKGVGEGYDLSFFEDCLVEGSLPRVADSVRHKDILLSASVGRMLRLGVDDRVEMLFVDSDRPPRRDRFRVCGLYSSGLGEMDNRFAIVDVADVQRLNRWNAEQVTGYEIVADDIETLGALTERVVEAALPYDTGDPPMMVRSVTGDFPQLFDWLATHDVNAAVIIVIMIVVALISMISALRIILLERIRMIGILKTLGMTNGSLRKIFVMRAARIVLWGLVIGNMLGIGLGLAQQWFGFLKLDETGYFLSRVPIALEVWWIVALNVGTMVVLVALMIFPTSIVSRITPEKTVRYQ
jgi:lipoprotein-releasing system permease protein